MKHATHSPPPDASPEPLILGIETSCDETSVAFVSRDGRVRANLVASQCDLHARFGGVVPEVAARLHIQTLLPLVEQAFTDAGVGWGQVEAVAVTQGPGLIGCLLVGLETAKTLAWLHKKPLIAVNHLTGHLFAHALVPSKGAHLLIEGGRARPALPLAPERDHPGLPEGPSGLEVRRPGYPYLGLIVSGGHTSLVRVESPHHCRTIAQTRDDAAGEAYDKVARAAGLGYPGGPIIDRLSAGGSPDAFPTITPPMMRRDRPDFSFSGLKTAAGREAERLRAAGDGAIAEAKLRDFCAAFQRAVVESLLVKTVAACLAQRIPEVLITGGVACNSGLRARARELSAEHPRLRFWFPHPALCTDNAAMIAGAAWRLPRLSSDAALVLNAAAGLQL